MSWEVIQAWAVLSALLFVSSLVHEDLAILAGGCLAIDHRLPLIVAGASLFVGVVSGDCGIYALGRLARRNARLERFVAKFLRQGEQQNWLDRRLYWLVAGCRLLPTMLFPTFVTMGWSRVPFRRFGVAVLASALIYVPALLVIVVLLGEAMVGTLEHWGWPVLLAGSAAAWLLRRHYSPRPAVLGPLEPVRSHAGMPPLPAALRRVPLSELIPPPLFYIPVACQWLWLGFRHGSQTLPALANPGIEAGGLIGESKLACMGLIAPEHASYMATCAACQPVLHDVLAAMDRAGLAFPVILKPDIGWRGLGVRKVASIAEITSYLKDFPDNARLMVQAYVPHDGEAGVFYARRPGEAHGEIFSMTFRYHPTVTGDGISTLGQLIESEPRARWTQALHRAALAGRLGEVPAAAQVVRLATVGSNRVGGLYRDARAWITPALTARFDEIARAMPEFWFGRFDIRFASIEGLEAGDGFSILEVNGAGAEAIHIWDPSYPLLDCWRDLFDQQRRMFAISAANRARGFTPPSVRALVGCQRRHQRLTGRYPASN